MRTPKTHWAVDHNPAVAASRLHEFPTRKLYRPLTTARTFDYLTPSADLASAHAAEFGITEIDRVQRLITEHHRVRPSDDRMTEAFREADLVDVSRGLLRSRIGRSEVHAVVAQLPYRGFQRSSPKA